MTNDLDRETREWETIDDAVLVDRAPRDTFVDKNDLLDAAPERLNLARILSVSGITVALVAVVAMGAERLLRPSATTFEVTAEGVAEPAAPEADFLAASGAETETHLIERRLALLEREIVLLQTQLRAALVDNTSFRERVAELDQRLAEAETTLAGKLVVARIDKADAGADAPALDGASADNIVTGSIPDDAATGGDGEDLSAYASADARASGPRFVTQTQFALSLDMHDDIEALKQRWAELNGRYGALLAGLQARALHQGTEDGTVKYRLLLGPIDNAASAAGQCAQLQARGVRCVQTVFGGELIEEPPSPVSAAPMSPAPIAEPAGSAMSESLARLLANPPVPTAKPEKTRHHAG